jgi:RecA/RadA recombinase
VANAQQKAGGIAAFIDAEHALDPEYAAKLGVDTDALLVSQPDTGEQALEIADMLIRSARSTSSSSTRSPRWCPAPRSRARWATATSVCRPA